MENKNAEWQVKDRLYILKGDRQPIVYKIPSKHSARHSLLYFDEVEQKQRELKYATNQSSCFVDEQKGAATLGQIVFRNGVLNVPKRQVALQKLLSLYHPMKDRIYYEDNPQEVATNQVDWIELEFQAVKLAIELEIDEAEAILRMEKGSAVSKMSSKEIKRDVLVMAKQKPQEFIAMATNDDVQLRNIGVKAVEANIIKLSADRRTFAWASNGRKLFTVPFEEHPYNALAAWFKTDEGLEVLGAIEKKMK
tara:strand:+ start:2844 stop:3596 length:753 start_codon:yes stop_codon:yes gene_type:complete